MASLSITSRATYDGRTMTLTCSSRTDVAKNCSYIDWTLTTKGGASASWYLTGPTTVTINGVQVYYHDRITANQFPSNAGSTSGTLTVYHNNDGTKTISVSLTTSIYYYTAYTDTKNWALDNIPRQATLSSAPNFNDEGNPTITYSNPAGNAITSLQARIENIPNGGSVIPYVGYRDISKTGTSYTFNLTEAERNTLRSACKNSNTLAVKFVVRTIIGGIEYWSTLDRTLTIANATPTVTSATTVDVNNTTIALTGSSGTIVKGYSNLKVSNIVASAYKSATLKSVIVDDISETYTSGYAKTINKYTKNNVAIKIVDSRGNTSATLTKTLGFVNYTPVTKGNISVARSSSGVGEGLTLTLDGTWFNGSFGAVTNTLAVSYRFKETSSSTWTTGATALTVTKNGNKFSINQAIRGDTTSGFDINKTFNLEVIFADKLSTATFSIIVSAGSPAIAIKGNKIALGGKFDDSLDTDIQFRKCPFPVGYIYMSMSNINPGTIFGGTWTQISGQFLYCTNSSKTTGGGTTTGSHTLTLSEVPKHYHDVRWGNSSGSGITISNSGSGQTVLTLNSWGWTENKKGEKPSGANVYTGVEGGDGGHTHPQSLPPYMTCYAWYRSK